MAADGCHQDRDDSRVAAAAGIDIITLALRALHDFGLSLSREQTCGTIALTQRPLSRRLIEGDSNFEYPNLIRAKNVGSLVCNRGICGTSSAKNLSKNKVVFRSAKERSFAERKETNGGVIHRRVQGITAAGRSQTDRCRRAAHLRCESLCSGAWKIEWPMRERHQSGREPRRARVAFSVSA